jgi:lysophospholipase L1-like esterase
MRFTSDVHFNATGHQAFADAIVDEVARVLDTADVSSVGARP